LLGIQAKFDVLQAKFTAHLVNQNKPPPTPTETNRLTGQPHPEENETHIVNGTTWYYCSNCYSGCHYIFYLYARTIKLFLVG
jgi:hypothetical protein